MNEKDYVVVFGGCGLDLTFKQEKNGDYLVAPTIISFGGKGANQAVALSRAGVNVKIITQIGDGDDKISKMIIDNLIANDIDVSCVSNTKKVNNDINKIYLLNNGDNKIIRKTNATNCFTSELIYKNKEIIKNARCVVTQMKLPQDVCNELINFCYDNRVPIVVTPYISAKNNKFLTKNLINKITLIVANEEECKVTFDNKSIESCVKDYSKKLIVTLGKKGVVFHNGEKIINFQAFKTNNVVDTTGAGDTFIGNFIASLILGDSVENAIIRGMGASTIKIQSLTAQAGMPTKKQLDQFLEDYFLNNNN